MTDQTPTDWTAVGETQLPDAVALRRAIHTEPEIGLHCPRTAEKVKAALAGLPLTLHEGTRTTGFVAVLNGGAGGNGRTVLLRGDHDALPMKEATGLPFASTIRRRDARLRPRRAHRHAGRRGQGAQSARKDELPGTVVFMFQPGEEGYHGAREMIADGLIEVAKPDGAFALHVSPNMGAGTVVTRAGPLLASTDTLHITVTGRGGHAAMPHESVDPIPVACEIVLALNTMIARTVPVVDPAVLTMTQIHGGSSHNIIPNEVMLMGTLRTLSEETRTKTRAAAVRIAEQVAAAHRCTAEATIEEGYPVTMNDPRAVAIMREATAAVGAEVGADGRAHDGRRGLLLRAARRAGGHGLHRRGPDGQRSRDQPRPPQHRHDDRGRRDGHRHRAPLRHGGAVFGGGLGLRRQVLPGTVRGSVG